MTGAILCNGGHYVSMVRYLPIRVLMRWQTRLAERPLKESDAVPRIYACAVCFDYDTADDEFLVALGGLLKGA